MSEEQPTTEEETTEDPLPFPILRKAIIEMIEKEPDAIKIRQIATWVLGLGGETPEMEQLHEFMVKNQDYHEKQEIRLNTLEGRINAFPEFMTSEKFKTIAKIGLGLAAGLGLTQIGDILTVLGVI